MACPAPLFILMLILSSATVNNSKPVRLFNKKAEQVFQIPAAPTGIPVNDSVKEEVESLKRDLVSKEPINDKSVSVTIDKSAQSESNRLVFTSVEQVPEFPGGLTAFGNFLGRTIRYPADSREKGIQGKVIISFIVEKDGTLTNFKVVKGLENDINQEAIRVLNLSPKWTPGIQNGKLVRVAFSVPIAFTLVDTPSPQSSENNADSTGSKTFKGEPLTKTDTSKTVAALQVNTTQSPLVILDGKEITDVSVLNPNDIQSISVLKNKAAKALYGAKGANGGNHCNF